MIDDLKCPECGEKDLFYRKVHRRMPTWQRVVIFIFGLFCIYGAIQVVQDTGNPISLVGFAFGILAIWIAVVKKDTFTSVRFKCGECSHEWDVEIQGTSYARKWQELPATEWQKVVSGRTIPGLGN